MPARAGLITQRQNEIRDLEAELLDTVWYDVEVDPSLQPITSEELNRGVHKAPDVRLDLYCRGFWEKQQSAFLVRVCHPNVDSYKTFPRKTDLPTSRK